jgi:hypothetical protein
MTLYIGNIRREDTNIVIVNFLTTGLADLIGISTDSDLEAQPTEFCKRNSYTINLM